MNGIDSLLEKISYYKGSYRRVITARNKVSRILNMITIVALVGVAFLLISTGFTMFWESLAMLVLLTWIKAYSLFLKSDTKDLDFSLIKDSFASKLDLPSFIFLEGLLNTHQVDFLEQLSLQMINYKNAPKILARIGVDYGKFKEVITKSKFDTDITLNTNLPGFIAKLEKYQQDLGKSKIDLDLFFFILLKYLWVKQSRILGITDLEIDSLFEYYKYSTVRENYYKRWKKLSALKPLGVMNRAYTARISENLEMFSEDLTAKAARGKFVIALSREDLLQEVIYAYLDNSISILTGMVGVGKSTVLNYLAVKMVLEDVPVELRDKRLIKFDYIRAFANYNNFDEYKRYLIQSFEEAGKSGNIILVIDNVEVMLDVRADLRAEIVSILEDAVDNKGLKLILTTNSQALKSELKDISNIINRASIIEIPPSDKKASLQILMDRAIELESKTGVESSIDAIRRLVDLSDKFEADTAMPLKAIKVLDQGVKAARRSGLNYLSKKDIEGIVSDKLGVKVGDVDEEEVRKLMRLESELHKQIIGQTAAVKAVSDAIRRARAGLVDGNKGPIASFLFYGPTGVGKTEVSKVLTSQYFGDKKFMIRLDMSEYQEERNLGRLIGEMGPEGYVPGYLTKSVLKYPYSLILLDEIEKANPRVLDLFLQILDEGELKNGLGNKVNFRNTIIIATSNVGSNKIAEFTSRGNQYEQIKSEIETELANFFRVEFLNRFSKLIMFKSLLPIEINKITEIKLANLSERMLEKGIEIKFSQRFIDQIGSVSYNSRYGAREVDRVITEEVESEIAKRVLMGEKFISLD